MFEDDNLDDLDIGLEDLPSSRMGRSPFAFPFQGSPSPTAPSSPGTRASSLLGNPFSLWPHAIGTQDCQKGDPLGTQFLVKWGPNGDPRQQNGDPKSKCLQN